MALDPEPVAAEPHVSRPTKRLGGFTEIPEHLRRNVCPDCFYSHPVATMVRNHKCPMRDEE